MSRSKVRELQAVDAHGGGDAAGRVSPLSSPTDDLNQQIIRLLRDDGRAAYDIMGQKLGVSGGTVRNRVTRMREAGMLRIVAVVDPVAVDYEADAMLGIKTAPGVGPAALAHRFESHPAVVYIMWVSGRFDLLVEVVCDEETELASFLDEHIHGHSDIARVEVMTRIGMFKNQFLLKRHVP
ncbi:MAG: Lrp/AsnC family transcriptional regulator [Immundisolibacterales bacterium]|nr:Lrp/AsnC family transcriptional regulator [Immundisolibacterales bacterium]